MQQWNVVGAARADARTRRSRSRTSARRSRTSAFPTRNLNQLTVEQLALGRARCNARAESVLRHHPAVVVARRSDDPGRRSCSSRIPAYTTVSLYRNNVGTTRYHGLDAELRQRLARGLSYSVAYTRSQADGRCLVGVRRVDPDRADRELSGRRQLQPRRSSATTRPATSRTSSCRRWCGTCRSGAGRARQLHGVLGALANDWTLAALVTLQSGVPIAVTQTTNFNAFAGFGVQRPNLVGDPTLPADQRTPAHWFNTAAFAVAPQFTLGSASRNPVRGPSYRNVDLALMRRDPARRRHGDRAARRGLQPAEHAATSARRTASLGAANFGTITTRVRSARGAARGESDLLDRRDSFGPM